MGNSRLPSGREILSILLLAALLRLALFAYTLPWPVKAYANSDAYNYVIIANNLSERGEYSNEVAPPYIPDIHRPPVYPVFLAATSELGDGYQLALILQALIGALTVWLVILLAGELNLPPAAGLFAALLVALEPLTILFTNLIMTETLFNLFLLAGLVCFARFFNRGSGVWLGLAALLFALASLTRPVLQYLPIFLLPLFWFFAGVNQRRRYVLWGPGFAILTLSLTNLWAFRNYQEMGVWSISKKDDYNLVYYRAKHVLADAQEISRSAAQAAIDQEITARLGHPPVSEVEALRAGRQVALQIFLRHPIETLKMEGMGLARLLFSPGFDNICAQLSEGNQVAGCPTDTPEARQRTFLERLQLKVEMMGGLQLGVALAQAALLGLTYLGAALGTLALSRRSRFPLILLLVVIGYLILLSSGSESTSRLRLPLTPLLALLAGAGFENLAARRRRRRFASRAGV